MTAQALVSAIDGMTNESSGDELFSELETQEYKEAFELFDKVRGHPFSTYAERERGV